MHEDRRLELGAPSIPRDQCLADGQVKGLRGHVVPGRLSGDHPTQRARPLAYKVKFVLLALDKSLLPRPRQRIHLRAQRQRARLRPTQAGEQRGDEPIGSRPPSLLTFFRPHLFIVAVTIRRRRLANSPLLALPGLQPRLPALKSNRRGQPHRPPAVITSRVGRGQGGPGGREEA